MTRDVRRQALVGLLALAAAVCLLLWAAGVDRETAAAGSDTAPVAAAPPAPVSTTQAARAAHATRSARRPVALLIPAIEVRTSLIRLGLQDDGTVEVPTDPARAGWFRLGPPPGAPGSSVILGHVDSTSGPAVFFRLSQLERGDVVVVRLDDGTTARFAVRSVRTYANEAFPAQRVYGRQGRRQLNLVTCGGAYDAARGGYQANVVVNAHLA